MEHYPYPELTKVPHNPTHKDVKRLQKEVCANAASVTTTLGGGQHGYLGLLMPGNDYVAISHNMAAFNAPDHPGDQAPHANGASGAQIMENNRRYANRLREYREYEAVKNSLRKLMVEAIPAHLIDELSTTVRGFAAVEPSAILRHMEDIYGTPTPDDIEDNRNLLSEPWNPDDGLAVQWAKINEIRQCATDAGEQITEAVTMRLTLRVLEKSGVFADAVQKWKDKPTADRAWANFKPHFNAAERQRLRDLTAKQGGYHDAAAATRPPPTTPTSPTPTNPPHVDIGGGVKMYYCWTHGLGKNRNHTSATCNNKAEGHKDEATADNMMGGNNKIMSARARST